MIRAILDSNIYVSAAIHPGGPPGQLIARCARGEFEVVVSPAIVEELHRVFGYTKVRDGIRMEFPVDQWLAGMLMLADMVDDRRIVAVCADPDDDKFIAAAVEGRAGFLVTGDQTILALAEYESVRIVTPRTLLDLL